MSFGATRHTSPPHSTLTGRSTRPAARYSTGTSEPGQDVRQMFESLMTRWHGDRNRLFDVPQPLGGPVVLEAVESLRLDLTDAFARHPKAVPHLLQGARALPFQPVTKL